MKQRLFGTALLVCLATLGSGLISGCASSDTGRATGQQVLDDTSTTARVKTALAKEAGIGKSLDVNVTTFRGTVQLAGFVESRELADRAARSRAAWQAYSRYGTTSSSPARADRPPVRGARLASVFERRPSRACSRSSAGPRYMRGCTRY